MPIVPFITDNPDGGKFECTEDPADFELNEVPLRLNWKPPSWGGQTNIRRATAEAVVNDIDLLLTGGRLHSSNRALLEQVYKDALIGSDPHNNALQAVIQHFSALPEFHITNNLVDSNSNTTARNVPTMSPPAEPEAVEGYKAIVYLFMAGAVSSALGQNNIKNCASQCHSSNLFPLPYLILPYQMDSFNALVPTCKNLHDQYLSVRGDVAIQTSDLLPIDASTSDQPCDTFGLHPSLPNIQGLYKQGDAAWISNMGNLIEPMGKAEFLSGSKPVPTALVSVMLLNTLSCSILQLMHGMFRCCSLLTTHRQ